MPGEPPQSTPAGGTIGFRAMTPEDLPLMAQWLDSPHMRQWWGDPETELGYIRDMLDGRDTTRPFFILLDGAPVGYIQVWFLADNRESEGPEHPWILELPERAVGVDISLGPEELLSRGLGSRAVAAFVADLRAEGHDIIIIDPDPANGRAVRAYEKAGFRPIPGLIGRTGDALIMQHVASTSHAR